MISNNNNNNFITILKNSLRNSAHFFEDITFPYKEPLFFDDKKGKLVSDNIKNNMNVSALYFNYDMELLNTYIKNMTDTYFNPNEIKHYILNIYIPNFYRLKLNDGFNNNSNKQAMIDHLDKYTSIRLCREFILDFKFEESILFCEKNIEDTTLLLNFLLCQNEYWLDHDIPNTKEDKIKYIKQNILKNYGMTKNIIEYLIRYKQQDVLYNSIKNYIEHKKQAFESQNIFIHKKLCFQNEFINHCNDIILQDSLGEFIPLFNQKNIHSIYDNILININTKKQKNIYFIHHEGINSILKKNISFKIKRNGIVSPVDMPVSDISYNGNKLVAV